MVDRLALHFADNFRREAHLNSQTQRMAAADVVAGFFSLLQSHVDLLVDVCAVHGLHYTLTDPSVCELVHIYQACRN